MKISANASANEVNTVIDTAITWARATPPGHHHRGRGGGWASTAGWIRTVGQVTPVVSGI